MAGFHSHHPQHSITDEPVSASPVSIDRPAPFERPVPSIDTERNSYFRRLSTLSAATISKAIPESLLAVVDAVRGMLFALSQIYQTLQHYTVYAIDERLSAVLLKVLGPASSYMTQLIQALDRFDTVSRRALPSPSICRAVIESCRDNVTVFGKAVSMLSLQLKVLAKHDDVRYTRQMLLVLYGAMSEIAASWASMSSHIDAARPYLWDARPPPASKSYGTKTPTMRSTTAPIPEKPRSPVSAPPIASSPFLPSQLQHQQQPETPQRSHLRTNTNQRSLDLGKSQISRRHAGSFSYKDVEIGKMLPSYDPPPSLPSGSVSVMNAAPGYSTPTPPVRTMRRLVLPLGQQQTHDWHPHPHLVGVGGTHSRSHSRQGSQSSLLTASNSPSLGGAAAPPSGSSTLVDRDVIGAIKAAVEAAPEIWEMMDEMEEDPGDTARDEFREVLGRAKDVTARLRGSIAAMQEGAHRQAVDGRALHDDAHLFVKVSSRLWSPRVCQPAVPCHSRLPCRRAHTSPRNLPYMLDSCCPGCSSARAPLGRCCLFTFLGACRRCDIDSNLAAPCHFSQTVIQLSLALKTRGAGTTTNGSTPTPAATFAATAAKLNGHSYTKHARKPSQLSSTLRTKMVTLTNATQEFVMLLHVSSFSPAPTPNMRPYSPMVGFAAAPAISSQSHPLPATPVPPEDGRLGSNLSRNRAAAPIGSSKLL